VARAPQSRWLAHAAALASGALFGAGLQAARMTDPLKVLAFLDLAGAWDASLLFVLGAAVGLSLLCFRVILQRPRPVFSDRFDVPPSRPIDRPLLIGATLFGVGWGLAGYCPGPAIAGLVLGNHEAWIFVPAMVAGAALRHLRK
jgi:uncharacterized membrane protein YedE/YeeE